MDDDLVMAAKGGLLLYPCNEPDGVRLDGLFLRYDPALPKRLRSRLIARLLDAPPLEPR